ncbi:cytochrome c oxidase subunit 3 [Verrucomicrobiota bacterium sgz303538]
MSIDRALIAEQFEEPAQQREAATFGMWVFLATEVLFFGGLFLGYTVYRFNHPRAFAEASNHTLIVIGSINTAVLLVSSFMMVLGVRATERRERLEASFFLAVTAFLGVAFLVLKGFEYYHEIKEGLLPGRHFHIEGTDPAAAQMFFYLYFLMTGVHALHVTIGIVLIGLTAIRVLISLHLERLTTTVDLIGLYWHFVDIVWVFLFPLIYLAGRHTHT